MKIRNIYYLPLLNPILWVLGVPLVGSSLSAQSEHIRILTPDDVLFGADQFIWQDSVWKNKNIGLIVNHSSVLSNGTHLVDALHQKNASIQMIFAPEHGFRGRADAGEKINSGKDGKTGISIRSLYGKNKKPSEEDLSQIDLLIFDIQDVGVRFYTYLSTMYLAMEAAAAAGVKVIILDRPNPNGYYVDGPVLDTAFRSFVGMIPIPVVHGMTLGEMALLIKGEEYIQNAEQLALSVIPCKGYVHNSSYELPIPPSPNLPNLRSILLYPSICYFEACQVSVGRGTEKQFQQIGSPELEAYFQYNFVPEPKPGAKYPKLEGEKCYGIDLSKMNIDSVLAQGEIQWQYLFDFHSYFKNGNMVDRTDFMNLLMGTDEWQPFLKDHDMMGWRNHYQADLEQFKKVREKYLLYPD